MIEFADKIKAAVAKAEAAAAGEPAPVVEEVPATEVVSEATEPPPTQETQAPDPQAETQELRSKQLAALARRDRELREREEALKSREAQTAPPEPQQATLDVTKIKDPLDLQAYAIHLEFGDDAPQEIKDKVARLQYEQRLNTIESSPPSALPSEDDIRQRVQQETMVALKINEVHSTVDSGISSDYALLAAEAKEDPQAVKQEIAAYMDTVFNSEGRWCSVNEAVKAINDEMLAVAAKYDRYRNIKPAQATTTPTEAGTNEAPLSDAELSSTPTAGGEAFEHDVMKRIERAKAKLGIS